MRRKFCHCHCFGGGARGSIGSNGENECRRKTLASRCIDDDCLSSNSAQRNALKFTIVDENDVNNDNDDDGDNDEDDKHVHEHKISQDDVDDKKCLQANKGCILMGNNVKIIINNSDNDDAIDSSLVGNYSKLTAFKQQAKQRQKQQQQQSLKKAKKMNIHTNVDVVDQFNVKQNFNSINDNYHYLDNVNAAANDDDNDNDIRQHSSKVKQPKLVSKNSNNFNFVKLI